MQPFRDALEDYVICSFDEAVGLRVSYCSKAHLCSYLHTKFLEHLAENWVLLSTVSSLGTPKRHMICCQKNLLIVCEVIVASGFASIHLEKYSTATTV